MPDFDGLEALPSRGPLLVTLAVRPDEIELALATNGNSLRHRLLLALVAELTIVETADASNPFESD
jgi:hypothetical protein